MLWNATHNLELTSILPTFVFGCDRSFGDLTAIPEAQSVRLCRVHLAALSAAVRKGRVFRRASIKSTPQSCSRSVIRDAAAVVCVGAGRRDRVRRDAEGRQAGQGGQ
jgi:hypothetical protein